MSKKAAKSAAAPDAAPADIPVTPGIEPGDPQAPEAAAPEPAAPVVDPAEAERELRTKLKEKGFANKDPRAALWNKRKGIIEAERQELIDIDPAQARAGDAIAGATLSNDELDAQAAAAEDAGATEQPTETPAAPLATAPKMVKIVVDGVEREVSDDDVRHAGVAALQKQHAADARLQEAATYEAQLRAWAQNEEARLRALAADASRRPPPPATGAQAPVDVQATIEKSMGMLVEGQQKEAAELLASVLNRPSAPAAPSTAGPAAEPNGAESQVTVQPPPVRRSKVEIEEANRVFNEEYGDLSDAAFAFTKDLALAALRDPTNAQRHVTDIVRAAGNRARTVFKNVPTQPAAPAPEPTPTPGEAEDQRRRALKARIPIAPTGASVRSPPPKPAAPSIPTNKDYVAMLQRRSGNNSVPR